MLNAFADFLMIVLLNSLQANCVHLTNGELSQDLYSKNSAKFEGRCISHNSIFPWTCRLFHHKKKTSRKEFSTMQYPTETWIEYPLLSFFFESNFFGLKVPFMFDFAVCLPWLSIFFSFFKSQKSVSGRNYCFDSQFLLFTRTVTKRFTKRWHIFFLVLIDLWFVAL